MFMLFRHFLWLYITWPTVTSLYVADSWVAIKDKNGVCEVIEAKEKTSAIIDGGGPFKTNSAAGSIPSL